MLAIQHLADALIVRRIVRQARCRIGAARHLCDGGDQIAGDDRLPAIGAQLPGGHDLLDGHQHLPGCADYGEVQRLGAINLDIAGSIGARGMQQHGIDHLRIDQPDDIAAAIIAMKAHCGAALDHGRAFGQLHRHEGQVLLRGAQALDHRQRWPVGHRQLALFGDLAKARRQPEDVEA